MSSLHPGDEDVHYSDGSHRWICPSPNADDLAMAAWRDRDRVRAHMEAHQHAPDTPSHLITHGNSSS